jgi:hypothetical protein
MLGLLTMAALAALRNDKSDRSSQADSTISTRYRTRDGLADYGFSIERQSDGSFRAYIVSQPDYGPRGTSSHSTHRHTDFRGRSYVCWSEPMRSTEDALRVSAEWADATQDYIRSGRRF